MRKSHVEELKKCPDCGHEVRVGENGKLVPHDKDGLEPNGPGYWSGNNPEGVGHLQCHPSYEPLLSMGCSVGPRVDLGSVKFGGIFPLDQGPQFFSASLVPAPLCDECKEGMKVHKNKDWVCETKGCSLQGLVVLSGYLQVFPALPV